MAGTTACGLPCPLKPMAGGERRPGLTLVISTRQAGPAFSAYLRHLRRTAGVARLQILVALNPGRESLSSVYQRLLEQARYAVVCCLHDDLRFARTSHWGRQILRAFAAHPDYALLGAAGSLSLNAEALYWLPLEEMLGQVTHRVGGRLQHNAYSARASCPLEALVLDGLLLACQRERLAVGFDQRLSGFHFYDLALSLGQSLAAQAGQGGRCGVLTGLRVTHLSGGSYGAAFEKARQHFLSLYGPVLPARLRPDLQMRAQPLQAASPLPITLILRQHPAGLPPQTLWQQLGPVAQRRVFKAEHASWEGSQAMLETLLADTLQPYVFLLDSRVQPLQNWLPALLQVMEQHPRLASLGVRLHDPETHLLCHNGLQGFVHPNGLADVALRGLNTPYGYRNALEWDSLGGWAHALLLRRKAFDQVGGLQGPDWVPGLGLNLRLRQAGWRTAVDSRRVGYWLGPDDPGGESEYRQFLRDFQVWLQQTGTRRYLT
ncbi:MAG: glycosyltransferase [Candidatus Sericytochromatia bacterium]